MSKAREAFLARPDSGKYKVGGTEFWFHPFTGQVQQNISPPEEDPVWRACPPCKGRGGKGGIACSACGAIDGVASGPQLRPGDRTFEYLM